MPDFLEKPDGARVAYAHTPGHTPTVVFLGGFASDMTGTKATYLERWCRGRGQAFLRFDYQGHGASSGAFADGTVGAWADDARFAVERVTDGPLVLVGSSMGGWIMLLVALAMRARIRALVGVAAAPDFTEDLMWRQLDDETRRTLEREGVLQVPSEYDEQPLTITRRLIEEGRRHLLLDSRIALHCPVRLLHGTADGDVPWQCSQRLMAALASDDVTLTLVKAGDHRLSEPRALALLGATVASVSESAQTPESLHPP